MSSVAAFSEASSREGLPLGLRSKCSTAEARHSRALATGTAMPAQEPAFSGSGFSESADYENSNFSVKIWVLNFRSLLSSG